MPYQLHTHSQGLPELDVELEEDELEELEELELLDELEELELLDELDELELLEDELEELLEDELLDELDDELDDEDELLEPLSPPSATQLRMAPLESSPSPCIPKLAEAPGCRLPFQLRLVAV